MSMAGFLIIFLEKQHQAMLKLKGNLFDAFAVVLVGNFTEMPVYYFCLIFTFSQLDRSL
jgi:hypothetical protein